MVDLPLILSSQSSTKLSLTARPKQIFHGFITTITRQMVCSELGSSHAFDKAPEVTLGGNAQPWEDTKPHTCSQLAMTYFIPKLKHAELQRITDSPPTASQLVNSDVDSCSANAPA